MLERLDFQNASLIFEWFSEFEDLTYHYNVYEGETTNTSPIRSGQGTEALLGLPAGMTYTLTVASIIDNEIITEIRIFEIPSFEILNHLDFEIGKNYNCYTSINFVFEGLQPSFKNKIHFKSLNYNVETTLID